MGYYTVSGQKEPCPGKEPAGNKGNGPTHSGNSGVCGDAVCGDAVCGDAVCGDHVMPV